MADRLMKFYEIMQEEGEESLFFNTKKNAVIKARNRCYDSEGQEHVYRVFVPFPKNRDDILQFMKCRWCRKREDVVVFKWDRDNEKVVQVWNEDLNSDPYDTFKYRVVSQER